MKRIFPAAAAALGTVFTALTVSVCAVAPADAQPTLQQMSSAVTRGSSNAAAAVDRAVQDGWRGAYNGLPPRARAGVPAPLRPPQPKPEPAYLGGKEPQAAPGQPNCANCVAITFDDGPVPETERLLNILARKNVRATFFVTGVSSEQHARTLRRVRDAGHTIGNHSDNHPNLASLSDGALAHQLDVSNRTIRNVTGLTPRWVRPPYGSYNARVVAAAKQRGMALALWDVDTRDWQHRNAQTTCSVAVSNARAGSIVLMHDIHAPTVDAAECVVDGLRAKGLRPVSLDEMIPRPEPGRVYTNR